MDLLANIEDLHAIAKELDSIFTLIDNFFIWQFRNRVEVSI